MSLELSSRVRLLAIVGLILAAVLAAGLLTFGRAQGSGGGGEAGAAPARPASPSRPARPARPARGARAGKKAATAKPAKPALPAAIARELEANRVVVVSFYAPQAKIDLTALREASAGARIAGAAFAGVDVTKAEIDLLSSRYGVLQDPAVLVLRPPDELVVRIDGFADRETVAQAAVNAAP